MAPPTFLREWMAHLGAEVTERSITQIAIPGSHHSASADVDPRSEVESNLSPLLRSLVGTVLVAETMAKWMRHQTVSIKEQLEAGIRYFDFSLERSTIDDNFFVVNGLRCSQVDVYMDELYRFLSEHRKEVVIVKMDKFSKFSAENLNDLEEFLEGKFGDLIVKRQSRDAKVTERLADWTIDRMWRHKKQIIFLFDTTMPVRIGWPIIGNAQIKRTESNSLTDVIEDLKSVDARAGETLQIHESVLSLHLSDALRNPMSTFEQQYGRKATQEISQFIRTEFPSNLNVVAVDFCDDEDFAKNVIALNK